MKFSRPWNLRAALTAGALLLILASARSSHSQTFRGSVLGSVTDTTGAAIVGATVTVHNVDTGVDRITDTTGDGGYLLPELPVGTYDITVELKGFQKAKVTGVAVSVAAERRVDVVLMPGEVTQQVVVTADSVPVVETSSDTLGGTSESGAVEDLPINGRDYTKMLILVPGATGEPNGGGDSPGS